MKSRRQVPLLAKVVGLLLMNLAILGLAFAGFVVWQSGFGLDSLLSGSTGEILGAFGDSAREEIIFRPREEWNRAIASLARKRNVQAAILDFRNPLEVPFGIPSNILERSRGALPPQPIPAGRPPYHRPPHEPPDLGGLSGQPPPPDFDGNEFGEPEGPGSAMPRANLPRAHPVFLLRGANGDGYWGGILLPLPSRAGQPPHQQLLLVRSDRLDGSGMFLNIGPWLWGGLGVLVLSIAFWTPFIVSLTRYIGNLTAATERIAAGQFSISLPRRGSDELGNLGLAIESMATRLDTLISGQKRFLRDAAHELCAPLARLRTGLGILEIKIGKAGEHDLGQVEAEAQELATLVEEILAFSRAGNLKPRLERLLIEPLIREVVDREAGDRKVLIAVPQDISVMSDPGLLSRALGNLVRNAVVHSGRDTNISVIAREFTGAIEINIQDDGIGVSPYDLPRLFEPFYRPDRSRTRETGGSGLGLAIVRTAIEACGGKVVATTPESGGFSVKMRFPIPASQR